jgi:hypothetical protein
MRNLIFRVIIGIFLGHVKNYGENIILAFKKDFGDIIVTGVFAISFIRAFHSC